MTDFLGPGSVLRDLPKAGTTPPPSVVLKPSAGKRRALVAPRGEARSDDRALRDRVHLRNVRGQAGTAA